MRATPTIPAANPGWRTCSSTLPSKGRKTSAPPTIRRRRSRSKKSKQTYAAYDFEYRKRVGRDEAKLKELKAAFDAAVKDAQQYVIPNQFTEIAEANGAVGINASTCLDTTQYFWSMPANRFELWAYMESDRIANPVPREFYKERDVVMEERRMRVDSSPIGKLVEQFAGGSLCRASLSSSRRRLGIGAEPDHRHRGRGFSRQILCSVEHRRRRRGRYEGLRGDAGAGEILRPHPRRAEAGADEQPSSLRKWRRRRSSSSMPASRSISRAITGRTISIPTMPSTTRSPIFSPTAAPRGSTAAWCATSRSPPRPRASADSPATNIQASSPSLPCPCPATRPSRCATPSTRRSTS